MYHDGTTYGGLSQIDHALQAASLARESGADEPTICAALLHDVGWKLAEATPFKADARALKKQKTTTEDGGNDTCDAFTPTKHCLAEKMGILTTCGTSVDASAEKRRAQHDVIGGTYLRMVGFIEKVPHLVEGHVLAKRYLCWKESGYYDKLSPGSKRTLVFQGGPMNAEEAEVFESGPYFELSKRMRKWDESAKVAGLKVPSWDSYKDIVLGCIVGPPRSAEETTTTCSFVRRGNRVVDVRRFDKSEDEPVQNDDEDNTKNVICADCRGASEAMSLWVAQRRASKLSHLWSITQRKGKNGHVLVLTRSFVAKNFNCALVFVNACGELAEKIGHHPDLHITSYRTVTIDVYTHKVDGLTESDFRLAQKIDCIPVVYSPAWKKRSGLS